jgi:hypothetical protein
MFFEAKLIPDEFFFSKVKIIFPLAILNSSKIKVIVFDANTVGRNVEIGNDDNYTTNVE